VACVASEGLHLHGMLVLEPVVKQQPAEGSSAGELVRRSSPAKQGWFSSGQQQQEQQEPPPGAILGYRLHLLAQRTAHELFEVRLPACWACMHACMHAGLGKQAACLGITCLPGQTTGTLGELPGCMPRQIMSKAACCPALWQQGDL
jgi:hypothetical protein